MSRGARGVRLQKKPFSLPTDRMRNANAPTVRCIADPTNTFTGRYFFKKEFERSVKNAVMPSGSLWLNDHTLGVIEVHGIEGEAQKIIPVGLKRLKLLGSRFPKLERELSVATGY